MKSLISRLRSCFLKAKVLVNTVVYFATKLATFPIKPIARKEIAKQKRLCFLSLEKGQSAISCKLKYSCNKCGRKHNIATCTFLKCKTNPSPQVSTADAETSTIFLQTKTTSFCKQCQFLSVVSTAIN